MINFPLDLCYSDFMRIEKMWLVMIFICLMVVMIPCARAQGVLSDQALVAEFMDANAAGDAVRLQAAYEALKVKPSAVEFLRTRESAFYQLYEAWALVDRVEAISERTGNKGLVIDRGRPTPETIRDRSTNQDKVRDAGGRLPSSNQRTVRFYPNQERYRSFNNSPNSEKVRDHANQDRISNQDRIQQTR